MKNKKQSFTKYGICLLFILILVLSDSVLAQTKPLEGKTEVGDKSPEADLMAYVALSNASRIIARDVCGELSDDNKVAIYNDDFKKQIVDYTNIVQILDSIKRRFDAAIPGDDTFKVSNNLLMEAQALAMERGIADGERAAPVLAEAANIATGLGSINSAVSGLMDLIGFFKTNIKDTGFTTTVSKDSLLPEVVHQLKTVCGNGKKDVAFYMPKEMPFSLTSANSELMTKLEELYLQRVKAESFIVTINSLKEAYQKRLVTIEETNNAIIAEQKAIDEANDELFVASLENETSKDVRELIGKEESESEKDRLKTELKKIIKKERNKSNKDKLETKLNKLETERDLLGGAFVRLEQTKNEVAAIAKQFDSVAAALVKSDDKSPTPVLLSLFEAERVSNFAKGDGNFVLELASNAAGSTRRVKQNLILDLFITSGRISYNAVAASRYTLYENAGSVKKACVVKTYVNFRRMSNLNEQMDDALIINDCNTP